LADPGAPNPNIPICEWLSTPIAYITSVLSRDPFKITGRYSAGSAAAIQALANPTAVDPSTDPAAKQNSMIYQSWSTDGLTRTGATPAGDTKARTWLLHSCGPDGCYYNLAGVIITDTLPTAFAPSLDMIYDPTNGTVSRGSIWRTGGQPGGNTSPFAGG